MTAVNETTKALLNFDPIAVAEKICPRHEKGSDLIMLAMAFQHSRHTIEHMQAIGDSHYSMPFDDMFTMILSEGFIKIYEKDFVDNTYPEDNSPTERYFVFFKADEGIILTLESYRGRVNNVKMYYNIELRDDADRSCTSSGGMVKNPNGTYTVYSGDHDIREAFRFKLNRLRENGTFLAKWVDRPFLWFLTYMDTKGGYGNYDYKALNEAVIAQFPQNVIDAITP